MPAAATFLANAMHCGSRWLYDVSRVSTITVHGLPQTCSQTVAEDRQEAQSWVASEWFFLVHLTDLSSCQ
jgi:hypothetical protein